MPKNNRKLRVFLCHASQDKPIVRDLSRRLGLEGWINIWLDEDSLLPGQDWRLKIEEAVETSDVVVIFLSNNSVKKEGYVQKELRYAQEVALEKPEDTVFLIPLKLEECEVPRGLRFYHWVDYFGEKREAAYQTLIRSLRLRLDQKIRDEAEEIARRERERRKKEIEEKEALEKAKREAAEKAAREKESRLAAEKMAREREREARLSAEKAAREKEEKLKSQADKEILPVNIWSSNNIRLFIGLGSAMLIFVLIVFFAFNFPQINRPLNTAVTSTDAKLAEVTATGFFPTPSPSPAFSFTETPSIVQLDTSIPTQILVAYTPTFINVADLKGSYISSLSSRETSEGTYLQVHADNQTYELGPYANGAYAIGPNEKFFVFCTYDGSFYAARIGDGNIRYVGSIKEFHIIRNALGIPEYNFKFSDDHPYTVVIYEAIGKESKSFQIPRDITTPN